MTFDWRQFLTVANVLYTDGNKNLSLSEAFFRCAMGRAYYAVHCHSRNHAISKGKSFSNGGKAHYEVIDYYSRHQNKNYQTVGRSLKRLHGWRKKCDYHDTITITSVNTKNSLDCATVIFTTLK